MNKAFSRVNWKNYPNRSTPISEANLNRGDSALDVIDNRVIELDTTKADKTTVNSLVASIDYDKDTGIFTIRKLNGTTTTIDTDLEKIAVNFDYDEDNRQIVMYDAQGHVVARIDLSDFITINEFDNSDTITFNIQGTHVSADVKNGSITGDKLQPNYLASIMTQAGLANTSAESANQDALASHIDALLSRSYARGDSGAREDEATDNAKYYKEQAERYATSDYATLAKSYAKGDTGTREGEDTDNAKYYKEIAEQQTITGVTATVDENVGTPSVEVTQTSVAPNKSFRFDFHNIKGIQGEKGDTGTSITDSYVDDDGHLIIVYESGDELDAGLIGTNIRQMTMAEYEALSNEEKMADGMYYWITDADGGTMTIIVSGVTDYDEVTNKPSINGVELSGNKTAADLGIYGNIIEISQEDFDDLPQEEKDDINKWYWIPEESGE